MNLNMIEKSLSKNKAVKIYKKILKGELKGFPYAFWIKNENRYEDASCCIRYLVECVLKWDKDDMKKMTKKRMQTYKLGGMLKDVFKGDLYEAIDCAYKYDYYPWNLGRCLKGYWNEENAPIAIRDAINLRGWDSEELKENYGYKFFKDSGLEHMLKTVYDGDIYLALEAAYEGEYKPWQLNRVSNGYWTDETVVYATKWLIEEYLNWDESQVKENISKNVFVEAGLGGMLYNECGNSPYNALEMAYPGVYKVWDLKSVKKNYWNKKNAYEPLKNMIEVELGYSKEDIKNKLCRKDFEKCGYNYVLNKIFNGDVYEVVNYLYPGEFKKYQLKGIYHGDRKETDLVKSIRWYD